jgi:hypothetical protein
MSFYPARSIRLAAAATLIALVAAFALLAIPQIAGAAAKCQAPKQAWKVNGRTLCLRTAKPAAGHAASESKARLSRWIVAAGLPGKNGKTKVPAKLRRLGPKVSAIGGELLARAAAAGATARAKKKHSRRGAFAAAAPAFESVSVEGPSLKLPDGVTLSSRIDAKIFEDGTQENSLTVEMHVKDYTLKYQPIISSRESLIPQVGCPTAAGLLKIDYTTTDGGTISVLKGRNVIAAVTEKITNTIHARGQVGRDARLHDVTVDATTKLENYQRGQQLVAETAATFAIPREGEPALTSMLTADVKVRIAGATNAQERSWGQQLAASMAANKDNANALAAHSELARWRMVQDEHKWYDIPNSCAVINYSPESFAKLAAGKKLQVSGSVRASDGGEAAGDFVVQSVGRGTFTASKAQFDPGSPARFSATAAAPDADHKTVVSESLATSTAGRAQWGWYAEDEVDLPKKLSGTLSASTSGPGGSSYFHAWAVYTLENVYVSDSGYISAFYKLTTAEMDEAENNIGVGCRWVGKGSGGSIADGDIELRKAPGGEWQHAVMYDVEIPNVTYVATDCGAAPMPPFQGELVGFVNMAMLGGGFEPVGDDFHLDAVRKYTDPASQRTTVGSWGFEPGEFE